MMVRRNREGNREKLDDYVLGFALDQLAAGEEVALVTLVNVEGTSPRPRGAQMAVATSGDWAGSLSGGCLERAVVAEALAAIQAGECRMIRYGRGSRFMDIQLPCGSAIDLQFSVGLDRELLACVDARLAARMPASLPIGESSALAGPAWIRHYWPRRRLIVAGSSTAADQLARLAQCAGFETIFLSPEESMRDAVKAHGIEACSLSPESRTSFEADIWTAIVFMFHDHDWERDLIPSALQTDAFYIGAMGSKRAHEQRLEMLKSAGISAAGRSRIRGPVGIISGMRSASDLSVSILAEIVQTAAATPAPLLEILAAPEILASKLDAQTNR